jgi:hypothetical protein
MKSQQINYRAVAYVLSIVLSAILEFFPQTKSTICHSLPSAPISPTGEVPSPAPSQE